MMHDVMLTTEGQLETKFCFQYFSGSIQRTPSVVGTYSSNVKSRCLSFLLVAGGQDHSGSSLCQIQSRGFADASVDSCVNND